MAVMAQSDDLTPKIGWLNTKHIKHDELVSLSASIFEHSRPYMVLEER